jgi:hypothetical protein
LPAPIGVSNLIHKRREARRLPSLSFPYVPQCTIRPATERSLGVEVMPLLYQGECKSCGTPAPTTEEGYLACRLDSGEIGPLPHPCEEITLNELGYTWEKAMREKRFVLVTNVVCGGCGHVAERFDAIPRESCLACIGIVILSVGLSFAVLPMPLALLATLSLLFSISVGHSAIGRIRVRDAQRLLPAPPCCPNCVEGRYVPFSKAWRRKTICQNCGQREVVYEVIGIS